MAYIKRNKITKNQLVTLGLIAAREGSVGVKNKNLIKIENKEITKIAVNLAINCSDIDNVILSTDSKKILNLIKDHYLSQKLLI